MPDTILIVEDNPNIRRFIHTTLTLEGYRALEASTVQEGVELARRHRPGLVLLDLALPDATGWDFLQAMQDRTETRDLRIVVLTASADPGMDIRSLAAGAFDFLTKPIAAGELVASVRRALAAPRAASSPGGQA